MNMNNNNWYILLQIKFLIIIHKFLDFHSYYGLLIYIVMLLCLIIRQHINAVHNLW